MEDSKSLFAVGDTVEWTYNTGGNKKTQSGRIICVIPPNVVPFRFNKDGEYALPDGRVIPFSKTKYGGGLSRPTESYVVEVNDGESYYWPREKSLRKTDEKKYVLQHYLGDFLTADGNGSQNIDSAVRMGLDEAQRIYQDTPAQAEWDIFETEVGLRLGKPVVPQDTKTSRSKLRP